MAAQIQDTQCTQGLTDSHRINNAALTDRDVGDVICILHPCSPAAFSVATRTAASAPQHILQPRLDTFDSQGTIRLDSIDSVHPPNDLDLALRFSSDVVRPAQGFIFGRNPSLCDIVLSPNSCKRVSNVHFRIFVTSDGVCMIEDTSTNGTMVDNLLLKRKGSPGSPHAHMLSPGSVIQILSPNPDEAIKFVIRFPNRQGHVESYTQRFQEYRLRVQTDSEGLEPPDQQPRLRNRPGQPYFHSNSGMHWDGGTKYNCVDLLGKGAFASVYRLADKTNGRLYAAKEIDKRKVVRNGVIDSKLNNEMRIMEKINHANVVKFIEYHDHSPYLYIIMEYVPSGDLQHLLAEQTVLGESLSRVMALQIFDAISYLHSQNITHRDIKPDNILIADRNPTCFSVKLSDFGLSKVVKDNETFLKTFCGTLLYCAPEVFPQYGSWAAKNAKGTKDRQHQHRHREYGQSIDIWSFGAVLWYSMCGDPPFEGVVDNTGRGMFERIMNEVLDPEPLLAEEISDEAIDLLLSTLQTDPTLRPTASQCLCDPWLNPIGETACDDLSQLRLQDSSDPFSAESFRPKRRRVTRPVSSPSRAESIGMQLSAASAEMEGAAGSMQPFASSAVLAQSPGPGSPGRPAPLAILPQNVVASANPLIASNDDHVFAKPLPRLGQLTTTVDSFTQITLNLNSRKTSWGRGPKNTIRFPDVTNTQIPKRGLIIVFYASGILEAEADGRDWTRMPGLHCLLATESTFGVSVNGQKVRARDAQGRGVCCKLYTGDIIRIDSADQGLRFRCDFYHGEAKTPRSDGQEKLEFMAFQQESGGHVREASGDD